MNLYLITNEYKVDYDTYDSAVVAAETEAEARLISPSSKGFEGSWYNWGSDKNNPTWISEWVPSQEYVGVKLIGTALEGTERGTVICSSFNAG
jgi:hypothetical protein